jgi:ATP-dependent Clp protease adaptor protein ClpS
VSREEFDESGVAVAEAEGKTRLKRPPLYKVLLHNDDYTSMEFVVFILRTVFDRTESDALTIMLNVHRQGIGIAGLYTLEIAEMKTAKVARLAEANEFPLLCTFEEVGEDQV